MIAVAIMNALYTETCLRRSGAENDDSHVSPRTALVDYALYTTCAAFFVLLSFDVRWLMWHDDITGFGGSAHRNSELILNEARNQ